MIFKIIAVVLMEMVLDADRVLVSSNCLKYLSREPHKGSPSDLVSGGSLSVELLSFGALWNCAENRPISLSVKRKKHTRLIDNSS